MGSEAIRDLLRTFGYEIRSRESGWFECLLIRGEEAWLGRGASEDAALSAALSEALPSSLARELLKGALERAADRSGAPAPDRRDAPEAAARDGGEDAPAPSWLSSRDVAREEAPALVTAARDDSRAAGMTPAPPRSNGQSPPALPHAGSAVASPGAPVKVRGSPRAPPPPLVRRDSIPHSRIDPPRSLDDLDILMDRIRDSREELGLCAPERQRLAMLAWICEARAHTDSFPEDARIRERVGAISRQLTEIGKTFWPGSVTALQLQMQPRDLPRHVLGGPAATWARAAELAERALRALEYMDERRGFDAYGWVDSAFMSPSPPEPAELLRELVSHVEAFGGSLSQQAVPQDVNARPEAETFRRWVRQLRWIRCSDVDPDRWARIAGRLRWWACHREPSLLSPARELEAAYLPEQPWARELGHAGSPERAGSNAEEATPCAATSPPWMSADRFESLQTAVSGKRMVFVSNRRDPDLQMRLKDALPAATLDWRVAEPKRLEALGEAIQQGAYDVVLGAIGFQSQGTDHLLARACRRAGVKYVRVNRGRPTACLRALARDL